MKFFLGLLFLMTYLSGNEVEGYATVGMVSHHFGSYEEGRDYNGNHHAYGAEFLYDKRYALAYLHFDNSRFKTTDIVAAGYRYDLYGPFGVSLFAGYQRGYCFEGLQSVECTDGKDNSGFAVMPTLYYRHQYFIVDLITQGTMVGLKLNIKLYGEKRFLPFLDNAPSD
ncbi:MAG: hypothetical protein JXK04_05555 [Campylobacterales bacterium]|nr:hypothetical protein [Campylobacterales bacterium]